MPRATLLAALLPLALHSAAGAAIWNVQPDGTGDFPTIQAAVDFASGGDEILLGDGTFSGAGNREIDYAGKAITIRSASGHPADCTIDGDFRPGFLFDSGEGPESVLADVTIVDTGGFPYRGAIFCEGSSPTFRNLVVGYAWPTAIHCLSAGPSFEDVLVTGNFSTGFFLHNSFADFRDVEVRGVFRGFVSEAGSPTLENVTVRNGGCPAMSFKDGAPLIRACLLEANTRVASFGLAGALSLDHADAMIENTRITGNGEALASFPYVGGSGISMSHSSPTVRDCVIAGNRGKYGGAVNVGYQSFPTFERCTIAGNEARRGGGFYVSGSAGVHLSATIVWGNCATELGPDGYLETSSVVEAECADLSPLFFAGPGGLVLVGDVLTADPLFCGAVVCPGSPTTAGVYTLDTSSPALGHSCGPIGALGPGCAATSVGAALESRSWGSVKSLYRVGAPDR